MRVRAEGRDEDGTDKRRELKARRQGIRRAMSEATVEVFTDKENQGNAAATGEIAPQKAAPAEVISNDRTVREPNAALPMAYLPCIDRVMLSHVTCVLVPHVCFYAGPQRYQPW